VRGGILPVAKEPAEPSEGLDILTVREMPKAFSMAICHENILLYKRVMGWN